MRNLLSVLTNIAKMRYNIGTDFMRPLDDPEVIHNLRGKEVREFLAVVETDITDYYWDIISWPIANPSNGNLLEVYKNLFVYSDKLKNNDINSRRGEIGFYEELQKNTKAPIFIVGSRGVGKTFCVNNFMNNHMKILDEEGIILFMIGLSKLYRKWGMEYANLVDAEMSEDVDTLEDYVRKHVVYIAYLNVLTSNIFHKLIENKGDTFLKFVVSELRKNDKMESIDAVCHEYKRFIENLETDSKSWKTLKKQQIVDNLKINKEIIDIGFLYKFILKFLDSNNYRTIYIFDGIDNVCFCKEANLYNKFISDLDKFTQSVDEEGFISVRNIFVSRELTYDNMKKVLPDYFNRQKIEEFRVIPTDPSVMLNRKTTYAKEPTKYFIAKKHIEENNATIEEARQAEDEIRPKLDSVLAYDEDLAKYANKYAEGLYNALNKITERCDETVKLKIKDGSTLLSRLFDNSIREFSFNFVESYKMNRLFESNNAIGWQYRYLQGVLLNGKLFVDSKDDGDILRGKTIPNIYYFDIAYSKGNWCGLCGFRLLQKLSGGAITRKKLFETLQKYFSYPVEIINEMFHKAIRYGLIDPEYDIRGKVQRYKLSLKGGYVRYLYLLDINLFYYMAIDTPLSNKAVGKSSHVKVHHNEIDNFWVEYTESCILTSLTFIRHISTKYLEEMKQIEGFEDYELFKFPDWFPEQLIYGMNIHLRTLRKRSIRKGATRGTRYNDLISTLSGII